MRRLALAVPLVLALSACTGSGSGASLEDRRAAYVEQAEQSCQQANADFEALPPPTGVADVADYADAAVDLFSRTVQEVSAVEPPEEDRAELTDKVLDPLAADVTRAEEYATSVRAAADSGDSAAVLRLLSEVPETSADVAFMREYGLVECAEAAETG